MARLAFVCGGTGSIGSSIVRRMATDHEVVFTFAHSEREARALEREVDGRALHLDLLGDWRAPDVEPDVLIYNAGVNLSGHFLAEVTQAELRDSFAVNVTGAVELAQAYMPGMADRGFGRVVHINSLYGLTAPARRLSYSASKFALRAVTISLALEFARHDVTVNDVCPGPVDSLMLRHMGEQAVADGRSSSLDRYLQEVAEAVPLGRLIQPDEVASAVAWLVSSGAASCNGMAIRLDGGALA